MEYSVIAHMFESGSSVEIVARHALVFVNSCLHLEQTKSKSCSVGNHGFELVRSQQVTDLDLPEDVRVLLFCAQRMNVGNTRMFGSPNPL